jgi:hypothetical protein
MVRMFFFSLSFFLPLGPKSFASRQPRLVRWMSPRAAWKHCLWSAGVARGEEAVEKGERRKRRRRNCSARSKVSNAHMSWLWSCVTGSRRRDRGQRQSLGDGGKRKKKKKEEKKKNDSLRQVFPVWDACLLEQGEQCVFLSEISFFSSTDETLDCSLGRHMR